MVTHTATGLGKSTKMVYKLAALFSLDALAAGGLQALRLALWNTETRAETLARCLHGTLH
ncbi:MAG: hypothetical protein ACXWCS_10845 [Burkholderiales bacterium]